MDAAITKLQAGPERAIAIATCSVELLIAVVLPALPGRSVLVWRRRRELSDDAHRPNEEGPKLVDLERSEVRQLLCSREVAIVSEQSARAASSSERAITETHVEILSIETGAGLANLRDDTAPELGQPAFSQVLDKRAQARGIYEVVGCAVSGAGP
jgi:hypothetical protein